MLFTYPHTPRIANPRTHFARTKILFGKKNMHRVSIHIHTMYCNKKQNHAYKTGTRLRKKRRQRMPRRTFTRALIDKYTRERHARQKAAATAAQIAK